MKYEFHKPVLLEEVIRYLDPKPGHKIIDATFDGGGHSAAILEIVGSTGKVLGIEIDSELLSAAKIKIQQRFRNESQAIRRNLRRAKSKFKNLVLVNDSYVNLKKIAKENDLLNADGILFDLGLSNWHIEKSGRGFSFMKDEPLDMRFTKQPTTNRQLLTAAEIVNTWPEEEIKKILIEYGEEKFARPIAGAIIKVRKEKPITTTFQLISIIKEAVPPWYRRRRIHFATKTFQALRIAVNNELENLDGSIRQALEILKPGGRLAVISFHSLEDRLVKNLFKEFKEKKLAVILTKKPARPPFKEILDNPRSRSAKLRAAQLI